MRKIFRTCNEIVSTNLSDFKWDISIYTQVLKGPSTHNQKRSSIFFIVKFSKLLDKKRIPITVREKSQQNNKKGGHQSD